MKTTFLSLLGLCLLVACGDRRPPADFVFINGSEHNSLDPQKMSWSHDIRVARCLYETLVTLNFDDLSIQPGAASSWDVSDDQLTYTFHLRDDARWSDGSRVTSHDFIAGWQRAMLPDEAADYSQLMMVIKGAQAFYDRRVEALAHVHDNARSSRARPQPVAGLTALDDHTLEVELERPCPYFLELTSFITFSPVPAAVIEKNTTTHLGTGLRRVDPTYWSDPKRLVTNGPYQLHEHAFRQHVFMTANPYYWNKAAVKNQSILELIIREPQAAMLTYQAGDADLWLDVPTGTSLASELLSQKRKDVHAQAMAGTYFYNFNCSAKLNDGRANPLADVRVRRALAMAIDRQMIVKQITRMNQPIARSFVPPGVMAHYTSPVEGGVTFDPLQAKQLLMNAGHPDGEGLEELSILYNTGSGHEFIAQAIKNMWKEHLGVSVSLQGVEVKVFAQRMKNQDYTICRASWFGDYPDPTTFLDKMKTGDGNNDCGWSDTRYDALLEQAQTQVGQARMKTLAQAEAILLEQQPMALIFQYKNIYLWKPGKVLGLTPNAWGRWRFESVQTKP